MQIKIQKLRVSLTYAGSSDDTVNITGQEVLTHLYGNPLFPEPPVSQETLEGNLSNFAAARAAQKQGGTLATALKNQNRAELVASLQTLAFYAQIVADNNLATLLSSGFEPVSTNRTSAPLDTPSVKRISSGMTGVSLVTLSKVINSRCQELRVAEMLEDGTMRPFETVGLFTDSRNIPVNGQVPGKLYAYQGRAIGGSTGYSDWSNVVTRRAA